jgi:HK97 family phage major capsid protein
MNRLQEILARKQEIRSLLEGDQEVDVKAIEQELRELQEEEQKIIEKRKLAEGIQIGAVETRTIEKPIDEAPKQSEIRSMKWDAAIATDEYRTLWAKDMMGQTLTSEERDLFNRINDEYREFTHTTENSQILIPKTVTAGIWKRAEEQYPLWADVRKFRVPGNLSMIKSDGNAVDGRWYTEDEKVDTDKLGFGQLDLTGCELAKAIQVTWKLKKMALSEFESYIITEIGDRMGISLSKAVYQGKGKPGAGDTFKPEPRGIKTVLAAEEDTPQIVEYTKETGVEFKTLTGVMAKLHSSYVNGATIYANNTSIWNTLANIVDGQGRPLFITDVQAGGVGRILGRSIKADAGIPEGEFLIANVGAGYVANINEDITMYREDHVRERLTDYMGYAIVDGDVLDSKAFVILTVDTDTDATPTV